VVDLGVVASLPTDDAAVISVERTGGNGHTACSVMRMAMRVYGVQREGGGRGHVLLYCNSSPESIRPLTWNTFSHLSIRSSSPEWSVLQPGHHLGLVIVETSVATHGAINSSERLGGRCRVTWGPAACDDGA
jgi:hypothetical protein